jgi:O-antigen/teichoic acid export membrane protein
MSYYRTFSKIWARKSRGIFTLESVIALRDNSKWHYKYQIIAFLSFQIDVYILIAFLEGSLITDYQVMMKLAAVPITILAALSRRFWIHAAGSYRDRESDFIRRKLHQLSRLVVFASLIFGVGLHLFGQQFLRLYTNDFVVISNVEFTWVAIWVAISGVAQMYDALFKGLDLIQSQIKYAYMMCILKIGLSIALILSLKSIEAPLIASFISVLVLTIFPAELTLRYKFKKI